MSAIKCSGPGNPCKICGRTKDGDCRETEEGLVLCHTQQDGEKGKRHESKPYVFCGKSDEGQGFGIWKPEHLCEELPVKQKREPKEQFFSYYFWDGSEVPVKRRRIDYPDGRPKDVRWAGTLNGHREAEIAPYQWFDSTAEVEICGTNLFVVRGELKADLLRSLGHPAISILGISERLIAELRRLGLSVVLCPDCDLADLSKWYAELTRQLPKCRHLLSPMKGLNWRQPPPHGGLGVEDWIATAKPDAATINAAITDEPWQPQTTIFDRAATLDDLLGPVEDDKLRRPRTDKLVEAISLALPLRFNQLTQRIENDGRAIDGDFLGTLYLQLAERFYLEVAKDRAADAALIVARRNEFHPVREYLSGLTAQLEPLDWQEIAFKAFNVSDPWAQTILQRQLIGCVARAMRPGCKLDTALVIQSNRQGIGKSTFWAVMGGDWFSDSLGDLRNLKDDILQLHSAWIHEWGEVDAVIGKRESEQMKKFLSATKDDVRKPYGRGVETLHRSCAIVGTTNRTDFIKDPTGNRRLPCFSADSVNLEWVKDNRDAIWGSALAEFNNGATWHYDREENETITRKAQDYAAEDPLRDRLESWMEDHPDVESITTPALVYDIDLEKLGNQEFARQVSLRFTQLGWRKTKKRVRGLLPNGDKHDKATVWTRL